MNDPTTLPSATPDPPDVLPTSDGTGASDRTGDGPRRRGRPTTGRVHEIRLPDDLAAELDQEAHELGIPRAEHIRRLLAARYDHVVEARFERDQ